MSMFNQNEKRETMCKTEREKKKRIAHKSNMSSNMIKKEKHREKKKRTKTGEK